MENHSQVNPLSGRRRVRIVRTWFMPDGLTLMIYILTGVGGMAYFVYGKKQQNFAFLVAGVLLCIYPYMVSGLALLILVGATLLAAPFLLSRM